MKQQIERWVQEVFNGSSDSMPDLTATSAYAQYLLNCAKRLVRAFGIERRGSYPGDFYIALRNYLLTFQTEVSSPYITLPAGDNVYGLWQDRETGSIRANYQLPEYVNASFIETAFLASRRTESSDSTPLQYNLQTDPMIFQITGFKKFKSLAQKFSIYGALNTPEGYTTLISLPTGGGKSLITQSISYQREGLTIIIVPTVSLAIDQVWVAHKIVQTDSSHEEIFYYSSGVNIDPILNAIKHRKARMLFISPEALILNPRFADSIKNANKSRYLKNIIIDEAHIVVDWGADFRIDYQCLESWRKGLIRQNPQLRTILLSATFECRCTDILKDFFSENGKWIEIRCDSLRHEPRFSLVRCRSHREKNHRIIELVRKCPHPMVIYVARPDEAEQLKRILCEHDIQNVNTFTGLTANDRRQKLIQSWVNDEFDVMVATSAFGVGVDKSDIRTVLHAYVPQNPNAYYQELGRGGRDRLPCLSIMCMMDDDINAAFQRINKKVMTPEKIIGRWDSMYNSELSRRIDNFVMIDTTIKPKYSLDDHFDDSPASEADIRWNVYVLLLLRRYNKIRIEEVIAQKNGYTFVIEVLDDTLRRNNITLEKMVTNIRDQEWDSYKESFELMKKAIWNNGKECWSEMFFETYEKVYEYCAGCAAHSDPIIGDATKFVLKVPVEFPYRELYADQICLFGSASQIVIYTKADELYETVGKLMKWRPSCLLVSSAWDGERFLITQTNAGNILTIGIRELSELINRKNWFYVSGIVAIVYQGTDRDIYQQLVTVLNELRRRPWVRLIHIIRENVYFDWIEKSFADLVDGRYVQASLLNTI